MTNVIETITYKGKDYPARRVLVPSFGHILISTTALNNALMSSSGEYLSDEASLVDERVCYFVELEDIYLDDNQLRRLLLNELDVERELQ